MASRRSAFGRPSAVNSRSFMRRAGVPSGRFLVESGLSAFERQSAVSGRLFRRRGRGVERPRVVEGRQSAFGQRSSVDRRLFMRRGSMRVPTTRSLVNSEARHNRARLPRSRILQYV